jgi:hydroxymethylpyrimidine pyrophosphatase-like HAD family hydrolase
MNKQPKIFFIDLDGTTLDKHNNHSNDGDLINFISKENIDAIKFKNKTTPVVISTGRPAIKVIPLLMALDIEYAVIQNGAMVINKNGKIIYKKLMSQTDALDILDFTIKNKLGIKINDSNSIFGLRLIYKIIAKKFK